MDDGDRGAADRSRVSPRALQLCRFGINRNLLFLVLALASLVVEPGALCARVLCLREHAYADDCPHGYHAGIDSDVRVLFSYAVSHWIGHRLRPGHCCQRSGYCAAAACSRHGAFAWDELEGIIEGCAGGGCCRRIES